jgi:hypothetical protein
MTRTKGDWRRVLLAARSSMAPATRRESEATIAERVAALPEFMLPARSSVTSRSEPKRIREASSSVVDRRPFSCRRKASRVAVRNGLCGSVLRLTGTFVCRSAPSTSLRWLSFLVWGSTAPACALVAGRGSTIGPWKRCGVRATCVSWVWRSSARSCRSCQRTHGISRWTTSLPRSVSCDHHGCRVGRDRLEHGRGVGLEGLSAELARQEPAL